MQQAVPLPLQDFPLNGPGQAELLKKIAGSSIIAIQRKPLYSHGACYWNVADHISKHGGSLVQGWQINWLPELYIEATHHAVWQSPTGDYIDISMPSEDISEKEGLTSFSITEPIKLELSQPVLIENKHVILNQAEEVRESLAKYRLNNRTNARLCDELRKCGWKWSIRGGWVDNGSRTQLMVHLNNQLGQSYEQLHKKRYALVRRFFQ